MKHNLVLGRDRLEIMMYRGCLNHLNGMKLGNNDRMTFYEEVLNSMGIDGLW
jgi:hypothetical protein